jgi:chromosome partitioning protein
MIQKIDTLVERQEDIAGGTLESLPLPKFDRYCICNLRGGIGKTSLAFNLSFLTDDLLVIDSCPQGNLSYFLDNQYFTRSASSLQDVLLPYFVAGLGKASRVAQKISATNQYFDGKNSFFIPSSNELYMLPYQMANAIAGVKSTMSGGGQQKVLDNMLYSLKTEITREQKETKTKRCLIDTSPFFSGATHLAWHAADALIVPVRTDQQSINSLELLLTTLSSSASEFRKTPTSDNHTPKIQMIVLTHCGWSTSRGSRNKPNQQTKVFLEKVRDVIGRNITHFTTGNPDNHIVLLDDFLGTGRISSAQSKPIELLNAGESMTIHRVRTDVNVSVEKIKHQLRFISKSLW